jgi:hypothetical protein
MTPFLHEAEAENELQSVSQVSKLFGKHRETVLQNALERGRQLLFTDTDECPN